MILFLVEWLERWGWVVPTAFTYFSTRMLLAAATALILTIWLGPRFIKKLYEWKIGQPIRTGEECPLLAELHGKKKDTPTMGGVLMLFALGVAVLVWMDWSSVYTWMLLLATLGFGALGAADDYLKLRYRNSKGVMGRKKLLVQGGIAGLIALYLLCPPVTEALSGQDWLRPPVAKEQKVQLTTAEVAERIYVPFLKKPVVVLDGSLRVLAFLWILVVIVGSSNAVNLTDGLDGLAAGCLVMASLTLALFAFLSNHMHLAQYLKILYIEGSGEIAVFLFALAGAALGFLWYNGYPAQVFMGDTGSLALGGALGVAAVLLRREMLLAIVGGIFVAEAVSVILQVLSYRYRNKKRIFLCAPLHHHFEYKGWPETKVVIRFWIVSLLLAIVAVSSIKLQ